MKLHFSKMHGADSDYIYTNGFQRDAEHPEQAVQVVNDRHFGAGADGLVLILPSEAADVRMRIFNADGSEAQMLGNASRCVGKYVYENGLVSKAKMTLETLGDIKTLFYCLLTKRTAPECLPLFRCFFFLFTVSEATCYNEQNNGYGE